MNVVSIISDAIWFPALEMLRGMTAWYVIAIGLLVEYWFVLEITSFGPGKAFVADLLVNAFSMFWGVILLPLSGLLWLITGEDLLFHLFNPRVSDAVSWIITFAFAVGLNVLLEWIALRGMYKLRIGKRGILLLGYANAITVAITIVSLQSFQLLILYRA